MAIIGIDATPVSANSKGLPRFIHQLIIALAETSSHHRFVVFVNKRAQLPDLPQAAHITYCSVPIYNALGWSIIQQPIILRRQKIDLLFSCADRIPLLFWGDIIFYLFELPGPRHNLNQANMSAYARFSAKVSELWFPFSVKKSKLVIVSSDATGKSLKETYGTPDDKVTLIYPGRTESFSPGGNDYDKDIMRQRLGAPDGYVLHISSVNDKRDNTPSALRAFYTALPHIPDGIKMVIGGRTDPDKQGLTPLIRELNLDDHLIWTGFIADEDIADVFRSAELYLDTSLYEGFGYQVLEAISCETPVVCSNASSLPEVVGDAAITADPNDFEELAKGIVHVLDSDEVGNQLREKGLTQARRFHWSETVKQIQDVFDRVLGLAP